MSDGDNQFLKVIKFIIPLEKREEKFSLVNIYMNTILKQERDEWWINLWKRGWNKFAVENYVVKIIQ